MWWQGEDNCPTVVKLCWASLRKHCGNHKVIIITKDNYKDYVTLPEYIISKVKAGYISFTHLSDIIRADLLVKYGGLWIDSTMFVADDIPEEAFFHGMKQVKTHTFPGRKRAFSLEYYTIRYFEKPVYDWYTISFYRWAGFCFAAKNTDSLLFSFMREMFYEYWKNHDKLMHYLLIDYFLAIAFDEFPEFRQAWENIPVNNSHCLKLAAYESWDAEKYAELRQTTRLFKMTYKVKYPVKTDSGNETVYGHLLAEYGMTE